MTVRLPAVERRDQLLRVALTMFSSKGFHSTSMNDVAEAAGVTKPVLYQHFASKRQLFKELLAEEGDRLRTAIAIETRGASGPREQVERGMRAYFTWVAENPEAFNLLFGGGSRRDSEFAADVRSVEHAIAGSITELIQADIDAEHRQVLAFGLVGLAEGASRILVRDEQRFDPDLVARQLGELAWAGLRGIGRP